MNFNLKKINRNIIFKNNCKTLKTLKKVNFQIVLN